MTGVQTCALPISEVARRLPRRRRVVEFGSYDVNGSARPLYPAQHYHGVDNRPGLGVDYVRRASAFRSPFFTAYDTVICTEMLEHCSDSKETVWNAFSILMVGGIFIATMATDPRQPHGINGERDPGSQFYQNVDPDQLREWLQPMLIADFQVHRERGDLYVLAVKTA